MLSVIIRSLFFWGVFFGSLLGLGGRALAFRTAALEDEIWGRQAITWLSQKLLWDFEAQNLSLQKRKIWIHGGDSISTAWSTQATLEDLYKRAEKGEIPMPDSAQYRVENFPHSARTWYAGSQVLQGGLLGQLGKDWVLVSTAVSGSQLFAGPEQRHDQLQVPEEVLHPERVHLLTFSLGGNDVCAFKESLESKESVLRERLRRLKSKFQNSQIIFWEVPDVSVIRDSLEQTLLHLPEGVAKQRVLQFCRVSWDMMGCPVLNADRSRVQSNIALINKIVEQEIGPLYRPSQQPKLSDHLMTALAADCFHPSHLVQEHFVTGLKVMINEKLRSNVEAAK